jgi:hypothetical protein
VEFDAPAFSRGCEGIVRMRQGVQHMTITLHLTPEQMARLQAEADKGGLTLPEYAEQRLLGGASQPIIAVEARMAAIDGAMGALAGSGISSDDFMREKQAEIEHDEDRRRDQPRLPFP